MSCILLATSHRICVYDGSILEDKIGTASKAIRARSIRQRKGLRDTLVNLEITLREVLITNYKLPAEP